jgi:xanthine dehydrogenase YagR molybdenum-binding subunit
MADATQGQFRFPARARVRLDIVGRVTLECGFTDIGQGSTTVFPQILADALGIPPEAVVLRHGDSALPFAGPTYGSGTTIGVGAAVLDAASALRTRLLEVLGWPPAEVSWRGGEVTRGSVRIALGEAVRRAGVGELVAEGSFELPGGAPADAGPEEVATRTFGAVFAEVAVDRDLGLLRLRRVTAVYSVGRVMNERTARSQMIGGIVWGWGMAAMEASHTDPVLGRWLAQDLAGVALPVNADIPADIDVSFIDETDYAAGPLGAKGIGELAATGVAAAVANAVHDAIGVRIRSLPITPAKLVKP